MNRIIEFIVSHSKSPILNPKPVTDSSFRARKVQADEMVYRWAPSPLLIWETHVQKAIGHKRIGPQHALSAALVSVLRLYAAGPGCSRSHHECRGAGVHLCPRCPSQC